MVTMQCPECGSAKLTVTTLAYLIGPDRNGTACNACSWKGEAHQAEFDPRTEVRVVRLVEGGR